jgi:hypothetical protein
MSRALFRAAFTISAVFKTEIANTAFPTRAAPAFIIRAFNRPVFITLSAGPLFCRFITGERRATRLADHLNFQPSSSRLSLIQRSSLFSLPFATCHYILLRNRSSPGSPSVEFYGPREPWTNEIGRINVIEILI